MQSCAGVPPSAGTAAQSKISCVLRTRVRRRQKALKLDRESQVPSLTSCCSILLVQRSGQVDLHRLVPQGQCVLLSPCSPHASTLVTSCYGKQSQMAPRNNPKPQRRRLQLQADESGELIGDQMALVALPLQKQAGLGARLKPWTSKKSASELPAH